MIIYYDSHCKLCTNSSALWKKMDWFHQLSFKSFRNLPNYPPAMEKSLHVYHKHQWHKGFSAIIQVSKKLPFMWIFLPFMYIAGWFGLGNWVYAKIANNRKLIPVNQCDETGCRIRS